MVGRGSEGAARALTSAAPSGVVVSHLGAAEVHAVDGPVDVLYISAAGRYTESLQALQRWGSRVVPAGTMLIDVSRSRAMTAALLRGAGMSPAWRYSGREGSLVEYTRADLARGARALDLVAHCALVPSLVMTLARRRDG